LEGYEGRGCRRQKCPNDCSQHGRCIYNSQANSTYTADLSASYSSQFWDSGTRVCACDRGWEGIDCSQRTCPKGDDPVTDCASGGTTDVNSKAHNMVQRLYVRTAEPQSAAVPADDCVGPMQRIDESAGTCTDENCDMGSTSTNTNQCSLDNDGSTARSAAGNAANAQANFYGYIALKYTDMFGGEYFTRPILIDTSAVATQPARVIDRHYQWEATKDYTYCSTSSLQAELDLTTAELQGGACGSATTITAEDQSGWAVADKGFYLATSTVSSSNTKLASTYIPTAYVTSATLTQGTEATTIDASANVPVNGGFSKGDVVYCGATGGEFTVTSVEFSGGWTLAHAATASACATGQRLYIKDDRGSQGLTKDQFRGSMMKRYTADRIRDALQDLPNFAIPSVNVTNFVAADGDIWGNVFDITFTDEATSGEQALLECVFDDGRSCPGAQPKMHNRAVAPTRGHCSVGGDSHGTAALCHGANGVWHSAEDVAMTVRGTCTRESSVNLIPTETANVHGSYTNVYAVNGGAACLDDAAVSATNCAAESHVSMLFDSDYTSPTPVYNAAGTKIGSLESRTSTSGIVTMATDAFAITDTLGNGAGASDVGWTLTFTTGDAAGLSTFISAVATAAITGIPAFHETAGVCHGLDGSQMQQTCTTDGDCDSGNCGIAVTGDHFTMAPVGDSAPLLAPDNNLYGSLKFAAALSATDWAAGKLYADADFASTNIKQELGITRESGCGYCNLDGYRHVTNSAECPGTCFSKTYGRLEEVTNQEECGACSGAGTTQATCGYCGADADHLNIATAERCGSCSDPALQTKGDCTLMGGTWTANNPGWTANTWDQGNWVDNWTQGVPGETSYKWTAVGTSNTPHQNAKSTTYIESCTVSAVDISGKNYEEHTECSNRGTCDGGSGLCTCFEGHTGESCSVQTVFF